MLEYLVLAVLVRPDFLTLSINGAGAGQGKGAGEGQAERLVGAGQSGVVGGLSQRGAPLLTSTGTSPTS